MSMDRRDALRMGAAGAGLAAFGLGFEATARRVVEGVAETLARPARGAQIHGRSLAPECVVDPATGAVEPNPAQYVANSVCLGCTTLCGVRVRVDRASGRALRVTGNPYSPLSADPPLPETVSIRDSLLATSRHEERGLAGRATACGRGAAVLTQLESPHRITTALKRVGPRGAGRWQSIPLEQLVAEVVEGGDLFGEGHVPGLRALASDDPIDPARPELGPKRNQFVVLSSVNDGRENFVRRFVSQAFGSANFVGHGSYCGGSYRSGSGAAFGNKSTMPHAKPDLPHAEFVIFCGTAPANAGNPFKRQGWQLAAARAEGALDYVVIDPVLGHSDAAAARERGRWIPIRPATDAALALGMMRWMFENGRFDARYLAAPNAAAADAIGEPSFSNATHLVIAEPGHAREGRLLRASDAGLPFEAPAHGPKDPFVVQDAASGELRPHDAGSAPAELFVERRVGGLRVCSALFLLRAAAMEHSLEDYAAICGVPAETIAALAREFTSHGKRAAVSTHGGTMAGNGFTNAFALVTLNTLIGNLGWRGGTFLGGGMFPDNAAGPRYDLQGFEGARQPRGLMLGRNNLAYERSAEFAAKRAAGSPYPAEAPWFPVAPQLGTEFFTAIESGYPYPIGALVLWNSNPVYGIPGFPRLAERVLGDPRKLPLLIGIDPFINESTCWADYLVPDTLLYESWGWTSPWAGVPARATSARWPAVEPPLARSADGEPVAMESLLIGLAKALGLPGFGPRAIRAADGGLHPLERAADWYLRGGANIAFAGTPVPEASAEDLRLSGVERVMPLLHETLKPEEVGRVAFVLTRGGRCQPPESAVQGEKFRHPFRGPLMIHNELAGTTRSAVTGRLFSGVPRWQPAAFQDGTPMRAVYGEREWPLLLVSQKSVLMNAYVIGADRLRGIHPDNPVGVHPEDAAALGLKTGDRVRIRTPGGAETATVIVRRGVMKGVVAIEHGFGHTEFGARGHVIDGVAQPPRPALRAGVNLNALGVLDPTRRLGPGFWLDPVAGSAVRQGLPARLERIAA
ncbi:molybdopterin dinucleotide binding domain-containing protein [Rubritepida flocculans]|uniref:molybdopterin dinucleotide binding domain-containing protein n=1 Tax=Rubritepida flocculans TaxID=182403 RepID=UPI00042762A8|nr:molybdopterin dinucleotide binding domain-containing protein [Rubritepida flocculans]